jgi:Kdo2-lipid IVA lauroyltransferase/acyltransferase
MKAFRYEVEAVAVAALIALFRFLPLDTASAIGGFIGRTVGPRLSVNRKASRNLARALPGRAPGEYRAIIREMWDNLGRTFAEYPHLEKIAFTRMEAVGEHHLDPVKTQDIPCILFTGHFANWETAAAYSYRIGIDLDLIYRAANNTKVDAILKRCRSMDGKLRTYPKSSQGMRQVLLALKEKRRIGILIDQKYNQGLPASFFGRTAMTSPAFATLAQKFDCPLHPARVERLGGANFRITILPAMETQGRAVEDIIAETHAMLEDWITERPGQWLWLHRRWRKSDAADDAESEDTPRARDAVRP